jgi:hypothetical protein
MRYRNPCKLGMLAVLIWLGLAGSAVAGPPLRYLAINVGNASPQYGCWEYKLCRLQDVQNLRNYIATWKPDIIMLSEVQSAAQLTGTAHNGPILPAGYTGRCGESRDRYSGALVAYNAPNASHQHECVAWKTSRVSYVSGSARSVYGRNDSYGQTNNTCEYDFTGFRARLLVDGQYQVTAVAVHPNSSNANCRTEEIGRYWTQLADTSYTIIGGDWNTDSNTELQRPSTFRINYLRGQHWSIATHDEYSAVYSLGLVRRRLDHAFSNFGTACTTCGPSYGTAHLAYGSALGSYDGHPRADNGEGFDHRQLLIDVVLP